MCALRTPAMRTGIALLLAILLLLLLSVLATGMLTVATSQARTAALIQDRERARLAAENALQDAFAGWSTPDHLQDALRRGPAPLSRRTAGGVDVATSVERLDTDLFLLRARASAGSASRGVATARAALLLRAVLPEQVLAGFPAALTSSGPVTVEPGALIEARHAAATAGMACPLEAINAVWRLFGGGQAPAVLAPSGAPVALTGTVQGSPSLRRADALPAPPAIGLGPVPWARIPVLADDTALVYAPGDLAFPGTGRGILVVDGDLTLADSAAFEGLVLVRGHVTLAPGASVSGALRAGAGATLRDGATLRYRACTAWRVLVAAPGLNRAFRPGPRWWVPDFPPMR